MHLLHAAWHRKRFHSSLTHACFLLVLHHQWHTEWGPPSWTFPPKIIVPSHQEIESLDAATVSRPGIRSHHLSTPTPICFYLVFFFFKRPSSAQVPKPQVCAADLLFILKPHLTKRLIELSSKPLIQGQELLLKQQNMFIFEGGWGKKKMEKDQTKCGTERGGRKGAQDWLWSQLCVCTAVSLHLSLALFLFLSPHLGRLLLCPNHIEK